ncbi:MAG TPA: protein kinase [Pyrinomonadaceae bacterium]|nr:protein kinase [Pyrinomonadaceae bacterium]
MNLEGKQLGAWKLLKKLGSGANAQVWKAKHSNGNLAAIKILRTIRGTSSQFKRFKTEIGFLQRMGDRPGLLPILDSSLPDVLTEETPAWFAMPIAIPIKQALGEAPTLENVVGAVRDIAHVLAELSDEDVKHRDIKPENLYRYKHAWAVGDFGLVSFPDKEAITQGGRQLGPRYFIAPEMLVNPDIASGLPADVYSLIKTLWVLATGQLFPPPGQQRIEIPGHTLSAYVDHNRVKLLDRLIETATADDPTSRPSMIEVENELTAWLEPQALSNIDFDFSHLSNRIAASAVPRRRLAAQRYSLEQVHTEFIDSMMHRMLPLTEQIAEILGIGALGFHPPMEMRSVIEMFREHGDLPYPERSMETITKGGLETRASIPGNYHVSLVTGIASTVYDNGSVDLDAAHFVRLLAEEELCPSGMTWSVNSGIELIWYDHEEAKLGSAHLENVAVTLTKGLTLSLPSAVERFSELLELPLDKT